MKTYFIADTHFDSKSILLYENRPFATVEEMNETMIRRWNEVVLPEDQVYVIGDFGGDGREKEILEQLNGRKLLIKGNHDTMSNEYYRQTGFAEVYDLPVLYDGFFLLSHEPLYVNTNMPYANLFGHVHANPIYRDYSPHHFCVCVERTEYRPVTLDEILAKVKDV